MPQLGFSLLARAGFVLFGFASQSLAALLPQEGGLREAWLELRCQHATGCRLSLASQDSVCGLVDKEGHGLSTGWAR